MDLRISVGNRPKPHRQKGENTDSNSPAVPSWGNFLIPCLRVLADGEVCGRRDTIERSADALGLNNAQRVVTVSSGEPMYVNRSGWAMTHLSKAGAIESRAGASGGSRTWAESCL